MDTKHVNEEIWIGFKEFFADEYHSLKLTQKLSAGQTGYHSANVVVPTRDKTSALDNLALSATADQIQVDQMMATIQQMKEAKNILW